MHALELQHDRADVARARRRLDAGRLLNRLARAGGVDEAADAADPLGDERQLVVAEHGLAELLNRAVVVEAPVVAPDDALALDEQPPVRDGSSSVGKKGPMGSTEAPGGVSAKAGRALGGRRPRVVAEVAPQRIHAVRPVVGQHQPPRVRVPLRLDPNRVPELPLGPVGGGNQRRDRVDPGVRRVDADRERHEEVRGVQGEQVCDLEAPAERPHVEPHRNQVARARLPRERAGRRPHAPGLHLEPQRVGLRPLRQQEPVAEPLPQ